MEQSIYMGLVRIGGIHYGHNAIINVGTPFVYNKEGKINIECPVCGTLLEFATAKDVTVTEVLCRNCETIKKRINVTHAFFIILTSTGPRVYEVKSMDIAVAETSRILSELNRALTTKHVYTSPVEQKKGPNPKPDPVPESK